MIIINTKSNSDILCSPRNGHLNSHLCFGSIYGIKKRNKRKEKKNMFLEAKAKGFPVA